MLRKRTLVNIRAECPIISVRSASPVGSLSFQVKPRTRRWSPGVPSPFCWCFGLFFCRPGDPGSRCGVVWCFILFIFWWIFPGAPAIQPISHGNKPLVCHCHCLPVLFCVNFPCLFFPFLYHFPLFSLLAKGSGLFSMFLHLCLHGPLRIWWVHLRWDLRLWRFFFLLFLFDDLL